MSTARAGRPRASSREMLAEAACELYLEKGYDATSIADIAARAGVARSSFFNYAPSKGALLWGGWDERLDQLTGRIGACDTSAARAHLLTLVEGYTPDALAVAFTHADAMRMSEELDTEASVRQARLARVLTVALRSAGASDLSSRVRGAALAAALFAGLRIWASAGAGRGPLDVAVRAALDELDRG